MKTGTLILLIGGLVLLPAGPSLAQQPRYDTTYGPFSPASSAPSAPGGFSTITPRAAALPTDPVRALPAAVDQKPFSDYHLRPAISPYMNLYRFNPGGVVSNYYTLVRPFVEQEQTNQSLRAADRTQSTAIDYLGQKTNAMVPTLQRSETVNREFTTVVNRQYGQNLGPRVEPDAADIGTTLGTRLSSARDRASGEAAFRGRDFSNLEPPLPDVHQPGYYMMNHRSYFGTR